MKIIDGIFDGTAVRPLDSTALAVNQKVSIIIPNEEKEDPVMGIFGKMSHFDAEGLRESHLSFRGED